MTKIDFFHELSEVLNPAPVTIRGDESLEDLRGWDSMARVMFLAMADEKLGQMIDARELARCKTVEDLIALFPGKVS